MNVADWLATLGLERYVEAFQDHDVDAQTLPHLTEADLLEIGVSSVGHRRKLIDAISVLGSAAAPAQPPLRREAELRQLTVLYCQMTAAPAAPESEALRETIRGFHQTCTALVASYDGHAANFYGDCLLAYFGWPRAHEDDAERAVRAGLAMVRTGAKVGIATGAVVVGDLIHEGPAREQSAVGVTPNLAARLLDLATPGQVVVGELTKRLLGASFGVQALGRHAFKGIGEPVAAYAVAGERAADSRFDARSGRTLAPMVGRNQELALLLERWAQAKDGEGAAVLLVGEAGIGKSRLVRALLDACADESYAQVHWQCSPYHGGSALWPVIQRLGHAVGLEAQGGAETALDRLEALTGRDNEASALYATLLGLNGSQRFGPLEMTPQMLRARTLELLGEQLFEQAEQQALLLVVEDAHWIDPTTLELLERCLERIDNARLLILITSRPDSQPKLGAHPCVTRLSLNRLSRASVQDIVARLAGDSLQAQTRAAIVAQTDGVPLFVEELTKAVLETGETAIPASLHGSLMARLDRIPEVKEVAQIAACIGREFDQALLLAVAERPEAVAAAMDKLAAAELIFRHGDKAAPHFTFKHALVQEAAYESLLRARRQAIHARILQVLETGHANTASEILARHATGARQVDKAIELWQQAGDAALAKSAYEEAAGFLDTAVALIHGQSDGVERRTQEIELQLRLGQARFATQGYGAEAPRVAFQRAHQLLNSEPHGTPRDMRVEYGLWVWHFTRGHRKESLWVAQRALAAAQASGSAALLGLAYRMLAVSQIYSGEFHKARAHLDQAIALFDPTHQDAAFVTQFGVNQEAALYSFLGWTLCILGLADQSRAMLRRARDVGSLLPQVNARALTHLYCAIASVFARDVEAARADGEALAKLAAEHRLPMYRGYASSLLGWVALGSGESVHQAIGLFERGLADLAAIGSRNYVVIFSAGLARALAAAGRHEEALHTMERTLAESDRLGQGWCDAELWRIHGALLLESTTADPGQAEVSFDKAMQIGRTRGAKLWELRAAVSLARLWTAQGKDARARDLLAPLYGSFTEGFDAPDLVEARALLSDLKQPANR